ncbi:MAG TPA: biopolymer transporter ExbD [Pirellulales bacterium]|jgi:biopolymer transport protein ExbD|nr:biopolymer transporter ExbD [Pirellulales bacterium]
MPLKTHADEAPSLNLTSMVDVLFCLILFFMAASKFTELERKIGLQVPEVSDRGALTEAPEKKTINVYRDGVIELDKKAVRSLQELTDRLADARRQYPDVGVMIRGDGEGRFQRVAEALNACKQAGISELGISVKLANPQR